MRPIPLGRLPVAALRIMPVRASRANDHLRGILLIMGASVLFSTSDATAKYVTQTLPVIEVAWVRYLVFVLAALAATRRDGIAAFWPRRPLMQLARGLAILLSALLFLLGLGLLPMADAAAINFVSPLLITALAVPMLGEMVELRRWVALCVGLFGAILAAQPGTGAFSIGAVFPLLSALAWALAMVMTRSFATTDRSVTTLLWTAGTGLAVLSCLLPLNARMPTGREFALCLLIGVVATGGQSLVVLAYRLAPASLLAPFSYLQLISSTLAGYIVFGAQPAAATLAGAVIIAGSGLYSAACERART